MGIRSFFANLSDRMERAAESRRVARAKARVDAEWTALEKYPDGP